MHLNFIQLERAALADNIPAIIEALIACPSAQFSETPGWVTRKARDWIVRLLLETSRNGNAGAQHLKACRRNMIHARRYEKIQEVLEQQPEIACQVREIEQVIERRRASPTHGLKDPKPDLRERQEYQRAVGHSLHSACAAASRFILGAGLSGASTAAMLRSYKLVEDYGLDGPYYMPRITAVLATFRILKICRGEPHATNFEKALLADRYIRLRKENRRSRPILSTGRPAEPTRAQPESLALPWALEAPNASVWESGNPDHVLEEAVRAGNPLAVVSGLDTYNRHGGLAPPWLLQAAAWRIIALLKQKRGAGDRSTLTDCAQRLVDCERHRLIEEKRRERLDLSTDVKRDCAQQGLGRRATSYRMRSLGLLYGESLDAAIRETLIELRGTPLGADFEAAKKAFNRIRKAPHLLREHCWPREDIARRLGLPVLNVQKVGNEYPDPPQNP